MADIRNPFFTSVSRAVEDMAHDRGMSVYLGNAGETPDKEVMYLELL